MIRCKPNVIPGELDNDSYSCHAPVYLNDGDTEMMVPFRQIRLELLTIRVATMTHDSFMTHGNLQRLSRFCNRDTNLTADLEIHTNSYRK